MIIKYKIEFKEISNEYYFFYVFLKNRSQTSLSLKLNILNKNDIRKRRV